MPEKDRDERLLKGQTEATTSSDEYVTEQYRTLHDEVYGLNGKIIDISTHEPHHIESNHQTGVNEDSQIAGTTPAGTEIYNRGHLSLPEFAKRVRIKRISQLKNQPKKEAA